jgi:two-component system NtrC family sensor kinase
MQHTGAQHTEELSVLHEVSHALARMPDWDELFAVVLSALHRLVPCDIAALALAAHPEPRVLLRDARPLSEAVRKQARPIVCRALQGLANVSLPLRRIRHERASGDAGETEAAGDIQSICDVPLTVQDEVSGAITVLSLRPNAFDEHAVQLVETVANHTASAAARLWARPMAQYWPLDRLLEGVADPLLLLSPAGDVLAHNSAARALLLMLTDDGGKPGPGRPLRLAALHDALVDLFTGRDDVHTELEVAEDGFPRVFSLRLTQLAAGTGDECALAHVREVTHERVLQDRAFRNARLASIGELAASVAHELNNPLTTILGFADLLLRARLPSQATDDVEKIHAAALRSRKIAHDVLSFARGTTPGVTTFDLNDALRLPIRLVAKHFRADDIEIMQEFAATVPPVRGDIGQLQQVLLNLLQNAHDAIHSTGIGSCVFVRTRLVDGNVVLEVEDDGPGMPAKLQHKVFHPFFTTKSPGQGTGLGLSIVRRIVEKHGGTITVTSQLGKGTCFTVRLPIEPVGSQASDDAADVREHRGSHARHAAAAPAASHMHETTV